ncbi:Uncharacterized protein AXF42_Ash020426 [Apostasia shenzhenica]|uniref:Hydroxyproline-rich glycoprotein family protein n=1 Tax=Apostasia shenzhenica TaxID=1088818 RepID=A0A2H9ZYH1_9ASPA|nr:Uncharacterized protein AXF42_Ash020426 [Apostasia shenzhenica]
MMSGNGGSSSTRGGASIIAAAAAVGSVEVRFPPPERRSRWGGCFGGFSCFGSQKGGGKRIVPATRTPDGNGSANRANALHAAGPSNPNTNLNLSLLAPPSSPASFTNSALPSTVQSPSCFLSMSANSPAGPSSTMFTTGPYAHETQLVSPPVFSTYTTEPSTAPLTPPPELAHLTTPSSPDVPFAKFLSSSLNLKTARKENGLACSSFGGGDLQTNYPLYPGSPTSSLISPASATPRTGLSSPYPESDIPMQWGNTVSAHNFPYSRREPSKLLGVNSATSRNIILPSDSNFFNSDTSARFYLDQAQHLFAPHPHSGIRLGVSREVDAYSSSSNKPSKTCKQDPEEIEAYRASFGFSADEITTTPSYVEINDGLDDSFTMSPFGNYKPCMEQHPFIGLSFGSQKSMMLDPGSPKMPNHAFKWIHNKAANHEDPLSVADNSIRQSDGLTLSATANHSTEKNEKLAFSKFASRRIRLGESCSDAEITYRRARSFKETDNSLAWRKSPS